MFIKKHLESHKEIIDSLDMRVLDVAETAALAVAECFMNGGKLYLCGCGLSSVLAEYTALLFANKCCMERPPLPAAALNSNLNQLSGNDNFLDIYEKQVNTFITENDILWGMVSDGKCEQVIRALRAAAHAGIKTIALAGQDNGSIQGVSDLLMMSHSKDPVRNQEVFMLLIHAVCDKVDRLMFSPEDSCRNV